MNLSDTHFEKSLLKLVNRNKKYFFYLVSLIPILTLSRAFIHNNGDSGNHSEQTHIILLIVADSRL